MKKTFRFLKAIPYLCLALTIVCCSLMMALPASAANPLVGGGSGEPPYYSFDTVPSGLPSVYLPDIVSSAPNDCIIVQRYNMMGTSLMTDLYVAETPGSMSVELTSNSFTITGNYYVVTYLSSGSWNTPVLRSNQHKETNLSGFVCVVTPSLYPSSSFNNIVVSPVTYHVSPTGVLDVAGGVSSWLAGVLANVMEMFYADGALTFLGYLAIAGLSFSVIFLIIALISRFLKFGG